MADRHINSLQDHITIVKAFERSATHSTDTESVFAMMTPILTNIRIHSETHVNQADNLQALLNSDELAEQEVDFSAYNNDTLQNQTKKEGSTTNTFTSASAIPDLVDKAGGATTSASSSKTIADIFNECVPCDLKRIMTKDQLWEKINQDVDFQTQRVEQQFREMLQQLQNLMSMFEEENLPDFCQFLDYLKQYVCVPDLRRMVAAMMVTLSGVAVELTNLFDVVVQLLAPLFTPILSSIFDILRQFILLILEPLECIIDSIKVFLGKIDVVSPFLNLPPGGKVTIGPGKGYTDHDVTLRGNGPISQYLDNETHQHEKSWGLEFDVFTPVREVVAAGTKEEKAAVEEAQAEYDALVKADRDRISKSQAEADKYQQQVQEANQKVRDAQEELSMSEFQQAQQELQRTKANLRSVFNLVIDYINDAQDIVESLYELVQSEVNALLDSALGTQNDGIKSLWKKSQVLQIIAFLIAAAKAIGNKACSDDVDSTGLSTDPYKNVEGLSVVEDDLGNIIIQESEEQINDAFQNLGDLVEFTKDPVLDTEVAKTVERIQTPVKVIRKCQFQTSTEDAEQVNQWIAEVS